MGGRPPNGRRQPHRVLTWRLRRRLCATRSGGSNRTDGICHGRGAGVLLRTLPFRCWSTELARSTDPPRSAHGESQGVVLSCLVVPRSRRDRSGTTAGVRTYRASSPEVRGGGRPRNHICPHQGGAAGRGGFILALPRARRQRRDTGKGVSNPGLVN